MNIITIKELSEFLKVKESTLYAWVSKGLIPFYKLNGLLRFNMDEITEWIKRNKKENANQIRSITPLFGSTNIDDLIKNTIATVKEKSI